MARDMEREERQADATLLRMVAKRIHESTWWQHGCAVDARGIPCKVLDERATRWDTRGHLLRALAGGEVSEHGEVAQARLARIEAAILDTVNERLGADYRSVHEWQDDARMCAWKVRKALRATARALEGKAANTCRVCGAWATVGPEQWCSTCRDDYQADQEMDGPGVAW